MDGDPGDSTKALVLRQHTPTYTTAALSTRGGRLEIAFSVRPQRIVSGWTGRDSVLVDCNLRRELCELMRVCGRPQPSSSASSPAAAAASRHSVY